jgi:hypothetical protein
MNINSYYFFIFVFLFFLNEYVQFSQDIQCLKTAEKICSSPKITNFVSYIFQQPQARNFQPFLTEMTANPKKIYIQLSDNLLREWDCVTYRKPLYVYIREIL